MYQHWWGLGCHMVYRDLHAETRKSSLLVVNLNIQYLIHPDPFKFSNRVVLKLYTPFDLDIFISDHFCPHYYPVWQFIVLIANAWFLHGPALLWSIEICIAQLHSNFAVQKHFKNRFIYFLFFTPKVAFWMWRKRKIW